MDAPRRPEIARDSAHGAIRLSGFGRPFGLGRDGDGRLLVCDMDLHAICRLTPTLDACDWLTDDGGWSDLQPVRPGAVPTAASVPPGRFDGPHSVAVAADGRMFVTTYYTPAVHVVPPDGSPGAAITDGPALQGPATGMLADDTLLVTEYRLNGVFAYDLDGAFSGALGGGEAGFRAAEAFAASGRPGGFDRPHMCRRTADGGLIVADTWNHRLQRFDREGRFLGVLGGGEPGWRQEAPPMPASAAAGGFHGPVAIGLADDGRFVVTDWGNGRLQWFDADGRHLASVDDLGLDKPYDAQVLGGRCVIANSHNGTVLIKDI